MKIIFLDIDGVLNSNAFFKAHKLPDNFDSRNDTHQALMIDPCAVAKLNGIIAATCALVIISSSWRFYWSRVRIKAMMALRGFSGDIIGATPCLDTLPTITKSGEIGEREGTLRIVRPCPVTRGDEIVAFLAEHRKKKMRFVVLDDDARGMECVGDRFVKINPQIGLTDRDADCAIQILKTS